MFQHIKNAAKWYFKHTCACYEMINGVNPEKQH